MAINALVNFPMHLAVTAFSSIFCASLCAVALDSIVSSSVKIRGDSEDKSNDTIACLFARVCELRYIWQKILALGILFFCLILMAVYIQERWQWNQRLGEGERILNLALQERNKSIQKSQILFERSVKVLEEAITCGIDSGEAEYHQGIALLSLGRGEDAIKAFRRAEKNYRRPELYYGMGQAFYWLLKDKESAEQQFKKALFLKPDFAVAREALVLIENESDK